jgi:hypothetical protein
MVCKCFFPFSVLVACSLCWLIHSSFKFWHLIYLFFLSVCAFDIITKKLLHIQCHFSVFFYESYSFSSYVFHSFQANFCIWCKRDTFWSLSLLVWWLGMRGIHIGRAEELSKRKIKNYVFWEPKLIVKWTGERWGWQDEDLNSIKQLETFFRGFHGSN